MLNSVADTDIRKLKSLNTLLDKYLYHTQVKFEQTRMVRTKQELELFDKKCLPIFIYKSVNAILEDLLHKKQLFYAKLWI